MAIARDLAGEDFHVIAIIGDGAITGGMALEALNNAAHLGSKLIVILNDNGMSISPTIGALAKLMSKVRLDRRFKRANEESKRVINSLPMGEKLWRISEQIKSGVKGLVMPTMLWEELGFSYFGPFDGHNIQQLERALEQAKDNKKPTLFHIVTTKGKGYAPAEGNAVYFHGVSPKCKTAREIPTYSQVFADTIMRMLRDNPKVVVITPAMPEGNCLAAAQKEFPQRVFDVGICEQHAVTFAAGLAAQGFIPVVAIYSTFLQRAYDQIVHDVCLQNLHVVFAIDRGGIVGDDGKTHQGAFDISYLSPIPDMIVSAPRDENELQHLLYTAVKGNNKPMAVRYPRGCGAGVEMDRELYTIPIGEAEILRHGDDIAIVALGVTLMPALEAADALADKGIQATVIDGRFAKPLDEKLILDTAHRIKYMLTVEENALSGGFGSRIVSLLQKAGLNDVRVKSLGIPDEFVEHGEQPILRAKYYLDREGIVRQTLLLLHDTGDEAQPPGQHETRATTI